MKWGVRKQRPTNSKSKKYESLSERERLARAQNAGSKASLSLKKTYDEYRSKINDALDRDDIETLSVLQNELDDRFNKEVYKPLIKAGYDYVSANYGSDGPIGLMFGKRLSEVEYDEYGCERFVDEFFIDVGDMKVYR
jgi:hypothetical protein